MLFGDMHYPWDLEIIYPGVSRVWVWAWVWANTLLRRRSTQGRERKCICIKSSHYRWGVGIGFRIRNSGLIFWALIFECQAPAYFPSLFKIYFYFRERKRNLDVRNTNWLPFHTCPNLGTEPTTQACVQTRTAPNQLSHTGQSYFPSLFNEWVGWRVSVPRQSLGSN